MKYSGIGGQAVMEGVMMRNGKNYAVAVRKPDNEIEIKVEETKDTNDMVHKLPILRGMITFVESLVIGLSALTYSASFYEEEEEKDDKGLSKEAQEKKDKAIMTGTIMVSFVLALGIFFVFPYYISVLFGKFIASENILAVLEGIVRIVIFIGYIWAISFMDDIKRTFMYHGAEHKCINCIENGLELTVENVRSSSKQHKRCGTSFIFIVFLVSIFVFMFIRFENPVLKLVVRLVLVPFIAGISYEFIRLAGRSEGKLVSILSKPGMWLQNMTTREPDDTMIEVGIASVEAVFDWKGFQEENKSQF